jgi:predicted nuclease of predicted toxin-antitoxin system
MRLVVDMNLSPRWVDCLREAGLDAEHWSTIGETTATDAVIMQTAQDRGAVVLTNDLDFGAMLASSGAEGPSVIQIRAADLRPQALAPILVETIEQLSSELTSGALVTLESARQRVRVLPLKSD